MTPVNVFTVQRNSKVETGIQQTSSQEALQIEVCPLGQVPHIVQYSKEVERSPWTGRGAGIESNERVATKLRGVSVAVRVGIVSRVS